MNIVYKYFCKVISSFIISENNFGNFKGLYDNFVTLICNTKLSLLYSILTCYFFVLIASAIVLSIFLRD